MARQNLIVYSAVGVPCNTTQVKKQQEEDADREIEELKDKYEARLTAEREGALRLKGEAGILRKKFQVG